jgi:spermidine synthase
MRLTDTGRRLPLLIVLSAGSGCAALIYEMVWFQLLQLVIGSSAVSVGILLATVMGGMCVGSLALPRFVPPQQHPLRLYAIVEMGIAVIGILVLFMMPYVGGLYAAIGGQGSWGILLRGVIAGVCLLPPTLLIGATLPAIARSSGTTNGVGSLYGAQLTGAAFGCLLTVFYLLRFYDLAVATAVAAALSAAVASASFGVYLWDRTCSRVTFAPRIVTSEAPPQQKRAATIYLAIAVSGLCALGAAIVWTRLLSLILGASVYNFAIILAVFLAALGIGSGAGSALSRWSAQPRRDLGICQMLLTAAIAWGAYAIARSLPYWQIDPVLSPTPWFTFQLDLARCMWAILPAASLWGASFPLALAALESGGQDPGRLAGGVYAANTAGAVAGAVGFGLVFIDSFGAQRAQEMLIGLTAVAALLLMAPAVFPFRKKNSHYASAALVVLSSLLALVFAFSVPSVPGALVAYGRFLVRNLAIRDPETREPFVPNILYIREGMNESVAVSALPSGFRNFHVSGRIEASSQPHDIRLQRVLGHLPALYHPRPRSVLIVGFGSGVTAGTFVLHPSVEKIVICEIEPLITQAASQYFGVENYNVLQDPRVEVVYDDPRHYMLTTQDKFDVVASHPAHPWVRDAAALYTSEYFELVRRRLNPGGVISQWAPLYETSTEIVKSEIATFFEVFPGGTVWGNDIKDGVGYGVVLLSKDDAPAIDLNDIYQRLNRPDHLPVVQSLQDAGFRSVAELFATYAGRGRDLAPWLASAKINRDRNLRLQYLAGMGLNIFQNEIIYNDLLTYRTFPDDLFMGSDEIQRALRELIRPIRPQSAP